MKRSYNMPFAFAHPAAILPFAKKHSQYISVTALIFIVHAFVNPYFHIFQIGGIIVSGLTSSFCGLLIVSIVYKARD
ncbi:DUF4184 family protein [Bacillus fungorum]